MLKSFQARLHQYMKWEIPNVQAGFQRGRGTRDQIANSCWIMEKAREFQKNIYFCFMDYSKVFDSVDHNKLWKILKEVGVPDNLSVPWEICMWVKKPQLELDMEKWLVQSWERSTSRLCIVALLISLLCRVHHVKYQAGWITSWNQGFWEKCQ